MMIESRFTNEVQVVDFGGPAFKVDLNLKLDIFQKQGVYTDSSRLHTSGSSRPSYFWFIQPVILPVHLEFSYIWFILILFYTFAHFCFIQKVIHLVHLEFSYLVHPDIFHTSGSSRHLSYFWVIQNIILWFIQTFLLHTTNNRSNNLFLQPNLAQLNLTKPNFNLPNLTMT